MKDWNEINPKLFFKKKPTASNCVRPAGNGVHMMKLTQSMILLFSAMVTLSCSAETKAPSVSGSGSSSGGAALGGVAMPERGGLAVMVGAETLPHARSLAESGQWLVHIVLDDSKEQARALEAVEDLVPLITVGPSNAGALPFGPDSVNLVLQGAKPLFDDAEVSRVLAPKGLALSGAMNKLRSRVEPEDERYAPWTHFRADEFNSGTSLDTAVEPSTSLRWISQNLPDMQVRTIDGVAGYLLGSLSGVRIAKSRRDLTHFRGIEGYDVFSGVPLWQFKDERATGDKGSRENFVAHELGFIHLQPGDWQPAVLTDKNTGKVLVTYEEGLKFGVPSDIERPWERSPDFEEKIKQKTKIVGYDDSFPRIRKGGSSGVGRTTNVMFLVHEDTLIQIWGPNVVALSVSTGKKMWDYSMKRGGFLGAFSRDGKRVYVCETFEPGAGWGRWGSYGTTAIIALNAANGKELWRNEEWATSETLKFGKKVNHPTNLSELIEVDGRLYAYDHSSNIASDYHADLYAIDVKTGKIDWEFMDANFKNPEREYQKHGAMTNNMVYWNGGLYNKIASYSLDGPTADREATRMFGGNQRCVRTSGSAKYLVRGHTGFIDREGNAYQTFMTRGNCSMPNYPTYGAIVMTTDETCSCYNGFRGKGALVPARTHQDFAPSQRLSKPAAVSVNEAAKPLPESVIEKVWIPWIALTFFAEHKQLGPMQAGDVELTVDVQRHVISASKSKEVLWRYRSDGRVHTLPTVDGDTAYVASTGGTITALNLKDGSIRWRFLAGANTEKVVVNGQLESRWPVYNSVLKDGTLYFCAGRHQEADGGIYTWALDAKTGEIQQSFRYFAPISKSTIDQNQQRKDGVVWRGNRSIASRALMPMGLALNEEGRICFANRFNHKAVTARYDLYWRDLSERTKDRNDGGMPDLERPSQQLVPIDFAAWNGRVIHPVAHGPFKDVKLKFNTHRTLQQKFGTGAEAAH